MIATPLVPAAECDEHPETAAQHTDYPLYLYEHITPALLKTIDASPVQATAFSAALRL